jgi:hypothetical protein
VNRIRSFPAQSPKQANFFTSRSYPQCSSRCGESFALIGWHFPEWQDKDDHVTDAVEKVEVVADAAHDIAEALKERNSAEISAELIVVILVLL